MPQIIFHSMQNKACVCLIHAPILIPVRRQPLDATHRKMNHKNTKILQKALSSSDKVLMQEALKIAIQHKQMDLQASAQAKDFAAYRNNANQYAKLAESLHSISFN